MKPVDTPRRNSKRLLESSLTNKNYSEKKITDKKKSQKVKNNSFVCSVCKKNFVKQDLAENHILRDHYGLARINNFENDTFSDKEILNAYKNAIKLLKKLKCNVCDKFFTSALGLKLHLEICGKNEDELKAKCEICGNYLKCRSMKAHIETHKKDILTDTNTDTNSKNEILEKNSLNRPIRSSAKKANEFLKKSIDYEDNSDTEKNSTKKIKLTDDKVVEFSLSEDDSEPSKTISPIAKACDFKQNLSLFKLNISFENCYDIYNCWKSYIKLPDNRRNSIIKEKQDLKCSFCDKTFKDLNVFSFHYQICNLNLKWECKYCSCTNESFTDLIVHLIKNHLDDLPSIPDKYIFSFIDKKWNNFHTSAKETEEFIKINFSEKTFEEILFEKDQVSLINDEIDEYLPEYKKSPKFKTNFFSTKTETKNKSLNKNNKIKKEENKWLELNLFESYVSESHITFYTGGPVYSGCWCPFPISINENQILSLAINSKKKIFNVFDCNSEQGTLQFWNFGKLNSSHKIEDNQKPKLEFIIIHDYGVIFSIEWCPRGNTYIEKSTETKLGRLGLLALACADGYIRIINVPLINDDVLFKNYPENKTKIFKCDPVIILDKHPIGSSVFGKQTICKCCSWIQTEKNRYIAAGYGNGLISVFDLKTKSSLLKKTKNKSVLLKPKKIWIGHGAIINSIKWIPICDSLRIVSGSFDRNVKIWDIDDLITNITLTKRGVTTVVDWSFKYSGVFVSFDDCYNNLHNNVMFKDCSSVGYSNSLSRHKSCVWDFNLSDWTEAEASVDASGEAVISIYIKPKNGKKYTKNKPHDCIPLYNMAYEELIKPDVDKTPNKNKPKMNFLIDPSKPIMNNFEDMIKSYGIVFNDFDLKSISNIPITELERLKKPDTMNYSRLGDYPLVSLTKVQWNPNKTSFSWIFTAGESGLTRVSNANFLNNIKL